MLRCLKNNKGYMLVEIILAFALAMVIMFFMTELTIKLKNKNDDMLVRTLVATDQAIIYNTIMEDLYENGSYNSTMDCNDVKDKIEINGKKFKYGSFVNFVSEYATIGDFVCTSNTSGYLDISVPQLPNDNFDVEIDFNSSDFECGYDYDG